MNTASKRRGRRPWTEEDRENFRKTQAEYWTEERRKASGEQTRKRFRDLPERIKWLEGQIDSALRKLAEARLELEMQQKRVEE